MRVEKMDGEVVLLEVEPVPLEDGEHKLTEEPIVISLGIRQGIGHFLGPILYVERSVHDGICHLHVVVDPGREDSHRVWYRPCHPGTPARSQPSLVMKVPGDFPVSFNRLALNVVMVLADHIDRTSRVLQFRAGAGQEGRRGGEIARHRRIPLLAVHREGFPLGWLSDDHPERVGDTSPGQQVLRVCQPVSSHTCQVV